MTLAAHERLQVRVPLLLLSATAWILLRVEPSGTVMPTHHIAAMQGMVPMQGVTRSVSLDRVLAHSSPASLALGWALMLAAMMLPLLSAPVRHVRARSFAQRRARAIMLFIMGYAMIWMAAGVVLLALSVVVQLIPLESSLLVALVAFIALVWQCSPVKQRCLNRGHAHPELAAFGAAGDIDALRFGFRHAVWCVGSCWALMLLPLLVSHGHIPVMAAVALWLAAERLDRPLTPRWRLRGPGKAMRIAVAQARMRVQRSESNHKRRLRAERSKRTVTRHQNDSDASRLSVTTDRPPRC
jgi:predicted metal-binding membrane protein